MENELMLKIENVSKIYKLGEIGGTTLRESLQRVGAKILKKEDPTKKVGAKNYNKGEKFKALDNISFEVKKGERVGIIGHNGAGKSTLLKLISRVTGPSSGNIYMNGRVASMLEVGTGFHPELTGRENVYMNGAILGMTKKEIDAKMEDIIEFSEVRQFIDTPVKRYSSGMYVKLAFSVAAHLDSEIMIMDEVLAVGDMAFQNKCLNKMSNVSKEENRTILYVSHNMNTIRQLCNRVIVLEKGKIIFNGNVEDGISLYLKEGLNQDAPLFYLNELDRPDFSLDYAHIVSALFVEKENTIFNRGEPIVLRLIWKCYHDFEFMKIRITIRNSVGQAIGTSLGDCNISNLKGKTYKCDFIIDTSQYASDQYYLTITFINTDQNDTTIALDYIPKCCNFKIVEDNSYNDYFNDWIVFWWGNLHLPLIKTTNLEVINDENN